MLLRHPQVLPVAENGDGAVGVGAQDHGTGGAQSGDRAGRGVAIGVVAAAGDQGEPWAQAPQKRGILVGGPMMGDLDHIDTWQVGDSGQQAFLGEGFEVAEEEDGQVRDRDRDEHDDAGVVGALLARS
ncbi:hypothetical protein GCM10012280_03540 [Wenjunlia tyrosinilytica]|uniref:Uncharacterized protein n=1 Tax=Wenjunlia tyrosinilytica TaxID=1544741 RepID=A0A917ZCJ8_9ACTN|nr:hypothetical protein GCM10012280_03540 [Wenjunlia tyrosinilytica]